MRTRPGADRIALQELRATAAAATVALAEHAKLCARCSQAPALQMRCRVWWNLSTSLHATKRKIRAYEHAENPNQLTLPGM